MTYNFPRTARLGASNRHLAASLLQSSPNFKIDSGTKQKRRARRFAFFRSNIARTAHRPNSILAAGLQPVQFLLDRCLPSSSAFALYSAQPVAHRGRS